MFVLNTLVQIHQKTLSASELQQIAGYGMPGLGVTPPLWRTIGTVCGVLFFCSAVAAIRFLECMNAAHFAA